MAAGQGQKLHGAYLALNSTFANFVIEHLAADPTSSSAQPLAEGRAWFNTIQNVWKYCDIDSGGALRINTFTSAESLAAAVAGLNTTINNNATTASQALSTEQTRAVTAENGIATDLATEIANRTNEDAAIVAAYIAADAVVAANAAQAEATNAANSAAALAAEASTRLSADNALGARDDAIQTEVDTIEASLGLNADGTYTAPQNTVYLGAVTTQKQADIALDTAISNEVGARTTAIANVTTALTAETSAREAADTNLQTQITNYVNAQIGAVTATEGAESAARIAADAAISTILANTDTALGFSTVNGTLAPITGTNYINGTETIVAALKLLDTESKIDADGLAAETLARTTFDNDITAQMTAEVSNRTNADTALQIQITSIETGSGLNGSGNYIVPTGTTYLGTTTTLAGADAALDVAIKSVADRTTTIESTTIPGLVANIATEVSRATAAEVAISNDLTSAVATLNTSISNLSSTLASDTTAIDAAIATEATARTNADNGLQSQINSIVAAAGDGANALKSELNNKRYTFIASSPALVHTVTHNLGTQFYSANIMVQGTDGIWRNDIMPIEDIDLNSYKVTLTESSIIKASGQSNATLA